MTLDELVNLLMQDCAASGLPLRNQMEALGTAFASYPMAKGIAAEDLREFLDTAITAVEDHLRSKKFGSAN
jgi:hypothetical protein